MTLNKTPPHNYAHHNDAEHNNTWHNDTPIVMTLNITPGIMALSMTLKNATLSTHYAESRRCYSDFKKL